MKAAFKFVGKLAFKIVALGVCSAALNVLGKTAKDFGSAISSMTSQLYRSVVNRNK